MAGSARLQRQVKVPDRRGSDSLPYISRDANRRRRMRREARAATTGGAAAADAAQGPCGHHRRRGAGQGAGRVRPRAWVGPVSPRALRRPGRCGACAPTSGSHHGGGVPTAQQRGGDAASEPDDLRRSVGPFRASRQPLATRMAAAPCDLEWRHLSPEVSNAPLFTGSQHLSSPAPFPSPGLVAAQAVVAAVLAAGAGRQPQARPRAAGRHAGELAWTKLLVVLLTNNGRRRWCYYYLFSSSVAGSPVLHIKLGNRGRRPFVFCMCRVMP